MFKSISNFLSEVRGIIKEITWPDGKTLIQLTIVVILLSITTGLALSGVDLGLTRLISFLASN